MTRGGAGAAKLTRRAGRAGWPEHPAGGVPRRPHRVSRDGQGLLHRPEGPCRRHVRRRRHQPLAMTMTTTTERYDSGRRVRIVGAGDGLEASADLKIQLPAGHAASVYLAVGKVAVDQRRRSAWPSMLTARRSPPPGRAGMLSVDVGSGPVSVTGARGDLSVDTGSGPVEVSRFEGDRALRGYRLGRCHRRARSRADAISIDTGSGDIRLSAGSASRGDARDRQRQRHRRPAGRPHGAQRRDRIGQHRRSRRRRRWEPRWTSRPAAAKSRAISRSR